MDIQRNNKRIAKNTIFLYIRMFISMVVSLYTSRIILRTLGVEDYGIYNIVGGVVAMFSFINSTMSSATSRFISFELGKGEGDKLENTFNASFWCHLVIAVIIFILSESIGLWFIHYKMIIPEGREFAANIVFQLSVVSTVITIIQVPYNALIIAHEKLDLYAYVEVVNVFLRLLILFLLVKINVDKLILYAILIFILSTCISLFYYFYCFRTFKECKISRNLQFDIIKPMLSFSAWDLYGNISVTARTQGVNMLLNLYFGPVLNAAAGIASSVQAAVMSFAGNVNTAVRPQIVKYYAQEEYGKMESLINNACKLNFLVLAILIVPLCFEIDYILQIWLGEVPEMTSIFCVLTLLFNLFANMSFLINTGNHAVGKIFRPSFINGTLYILVIPVTYIFFTNGSFAWIPYAVNLAAVFIGMLSNIYTLHLNVPQYSITTFIKNVLIKCLVVIGLGVIVACLVRYLFVSSLYRLFIMFFLTAISMSSLGWYILLPKGLRDFIVNKIKVLICVKG